MNFINFKRYVFSSAAALATYHILHCCCLQHRPATNFGSLSAKCWQIYVTHATDLITCTCDVEWPMDKSDTELDSDLVTCTWRKKQKKNRQKCKRKEEKNSTHKTCKMLKSSHTRIRTAVGSR